MAAEITEGFKRLNPFAPEYFPSYYCPPPPPLNPSYYYSSYSHQTATTVFFNPSVPTAQTLPSHHFAQGPQVPEKQQQKSYGNDRVQNEKTTVPRPIRLVRGRRSTFSYGCLGSSIDGKKQKGKYEKRKEWKPRVRGSYRMSDDKFRTINWKGCNDLRVEYLNNFSMPKKVKTKSYSDVLHVEEHGENTAVMIRNIPNKYTRDMLMAFLDAHCAEENDKPDVGDEISSYDFLYLPIDFNTGFNKGYAFVNFTNSKAVWKFSEGTGGKTWDLFYSSKKREIAYAKIQQNIMNDTMVLVVINYDVIGDQGKKELVSHFETMRFPCASEDVLPVCFDPPRDGSRMSVQISTVGHAVDLNRHDN
ncbi:protein MEI2-like 1 [Malus domestica]|uniref:protein MEI2-like 1 n=1 Tax=Malus domestica TaxID=3750 RepID=UPI0004992ADC|nr:protein MEI2-like 1 [Malus domestica]